MNHYKHFTLEEREKIMFLLAKGYIQSAIAGQLSYRKTTIAREIRRNSQNGEYLPYKAQVTYKSRRSCCRPTKRLSFHALYEFVNDKFIRHQWSPEQIVGRLRKEDACIRISATTIYLAIYAGMLDEPNHSKGNRGAI